MELIPRVAVEPTDVCATARAFRDLPGPPRKPRERRLGRSPIGATRRGSKAPDPVHEAARIDERVLVGTALLDPERLVTDPVTTGRADQRTLGRPDITVARAWCAVPLAIEPHQTSVECPPMAISDRILPLCDLLLGAAYADQQLAPEEREEVIGMLSDMAGGLPAEAEARIAAFDAGNFDLKATAGVFRSDPEDERRKLLYLVSAVIEADNEIDLAEDDYLRALAEALALPPAALDGLTVDVEAEELQETFAAVRRGPPPPPPKKLASVDVDLD